MDQPEAINKILIEMHRAGLFHPIEEDQIRFYLEMSYGIGFDEGRLQRSHRKKVCQIDARGKIVRIYESVITAARVHGIPATGIYESIAGRQCTAAGFYWRYAKGKELGGSSFENPTP